MSYPWTRFWCEWGASIAMDGPFLQDPTKWSQYFGTIVHATEDLPVTGITILLGEAGLGKSTELSKLTEAHPLCITVDLGAYADETRLERKLTDCFAAASKSGALVALDSLDEAMLGVKKAGAIIAQCIKEATACPDVIIACRTGAWPSSLTVQLKELGEPEWFRTLELCMLQRSDVETAAKDLDDPGRFMTRLSSQGIEPLAATPVGLKLLLRMANSGELPSTRIGVYEKGLEQLVMQSPLREERGSSLQVDGMSLSSREALVIAERIAACTLLSGSASVTLTSDAGDSTCLHADQIAGGDELCEGRPNAITPASVRAIVGHTGLFSAQNQSRMRFAHRSFAEYLTARYLLRNEFEWAQLRALLFVRDGDRWRLAQQCYGIASWLADLSGDFRTQLLAHDPATLLQSDMLSRSPVEKAAIAEAILSAIESGDMERIEEACSPDGTLFGRNVDTASILKSLACPELADVVLAYLSVVSTKPLARVAAVQLAQHCELSVLVPGLLEAVIKDDSLYVRHSAIRALGHLAADEQLLSLMPVVTETAMDDPDDDLKGELLTTLWRRKLLTVKQVLEALTPIKRLNDFGRYRVFIAELDIEDVIKDEELCDALRWAKHLRREDRHDNELFELAGRIIHEAWRRINVPGVRQLLAEAVLERLSNSEPILSKPKPRKSDESGTASSPVTDTDLRRQLLEILVMSIPDPADMYTLMGIGSGGLASPEDFEWALSRALECEDGKAKRYAHLARSLCMYVDVGPYRNSKHCDLWLLARQKSPAIAEVMDWPLFVELNTESASKMKHEWEQQERINNRQSREDDEPAVSPEDAAKSWVGACLNNDVRWFPKLIHTMRFDEDRNGSYADRIDQLPVREGADDKMRGQIGVCAKRYLHECPIDPPPGENGGPGLHPESAMRALSLFHTLNPDGLVEVSNERLCAIAPSCTHGYLALLSDDPEIDKAFRWLQQQVPNDVALALSESWNSEHQAYALSRALTGGRLIDEVEVKLERLLIQRLNEQFDGSRPHGAMLEALVQKRPKEAVELIEGVIFNAPANAGPEVDCALRALTLAPKKTVWDIATVAIGKWNERALIALRPGDIYGGGSGRRVFHTELSDAEMGELGKALFRHWSPSTDPDYEGAHQVTEEDEVRSWRDGITRALEDRGAAEVLEHILQENPDIKQLEYAIVSARRKRVRNSWQPIAPGELVALGCDVRRRVVRSGAELIAVLAESARRFEKKWRENDQMRMLWNQVDKKWQPKDEEDLSQTLKTWFEKDVPHLVAGREVQLSRRTCEEGAAGKRVDIWVEILPGHHGQEPIKVVVEVKGSWNQDALKGIDEQLAKRYLNEHGASEGLYIVGWYDAPGWDSSDARKRSGPWKSKEEACAALKEEAARILSNPPNTAIETLIIDCSLA